MKTFLPRWLVSLWIVSLFAPAVRSHAHLSVYTFEELVQRSKYIFIGEVVKVKRNWNGSMLSHVKVERAIKGTPPHNIPVGYGQPFNAAQEDQTQLKVGHHYLFYVAGYDKKLHLIGITGEYYHLINNNTVLCDLFDKTTVDVCIEKIRKEANSK